MAGRYLDHSDYEQIKTLRSQGLTLRAIGEYYGVSRQAIHEFIKRRTRLEQQEYSSREKTKSHRDVAVYRLVAQAIKKGILNIAPCEKCGKTDAEAHHDDYNKPLEVRWLCRKHHREWHSTHTAIPRQGTWERRIHRATQAWDELKWAPQQYGRNWRASLIAEGFVRFTIWSWERGITEIPPDSIAKLRVLRDQHRIRSLAAEAGREPA